MKRRSVTPLYVIIGEKCASRHGCDEKEKLQKKKGYVMHRVKKDDTNSRIDGKFYRSRIYISASDQNLL